MRRQQRTRSFVPSFPTLKLCALATVVAIAACGDDDDDVEMEDEGPEVFTTLELTFSPDGGTAADDIVALFQDDDGDGVMSGSISPGITTLAASTTYSLSVRLANTTLPAGEQDEPQEEVMEEEDEHQFFFFGPTVNGPATTNTTAPLTHAYADMDGGGLPVGFVNTITTGSAASAGDFTVLLRHLPPVDGSAVKVAGLAGTLASSGVSALPGETDITVTYTVEVQ
ncbi:MAG: hypothetical protein AAFY60_13175 [Myxococcota bacterium]